MENLKEMGVGGGWLLFVGLVWLVAEQIPIAQTRE